MSNVSKEYIDAANDDWNEARRVDRWHATYNAALSALLAHNGESGEYTIDGAHKKAASAADLAHGKLVKP